MLLKIVNNNMWVYYISWLGGKIVKRLNEMEKGKRKMNNDEK